MRKRYVIYSACVGNYDAIETPLSVDDRFDYVLFSDTAIAGQSGIWDVRPLPYRHDDPVKTARWVKCHPETLFPDYVSSVWMDSNIRIMDASVYEEFISVLDSTTPVCSLRHPERDCIYQEMMTVLENRLETERVVLQWGHRLFRSRYPEHNGLAETRIVIRRHSDSRVATLDRIWWKCIVNFSRRDQLSFNYALWRCQLDCRYFLEDNIQSDTRFEVHPHTNPCWRSVPLQHPSKLYRYLLNRPLQRETIVAAYYTACRHPAPRLAAIVIGQWLRLRFKMSKTVCKTRP